MKQFACILLGLSLLLGAVTPAAANEMSALMPELLTLPAPSWVKPGGSITYHTGAATVPGGSDYFWRNEDGDWVGRGKHDKGKYYSRGEQFGTGGEGYSQVDIVALEEKSVAVSVRIWAKHMGHLIPKTDLGAANFGGAGPAGCTGNWWVNPDVLKGAVSRFTRQDRHTIVQGARVFAAPCKASNRTFDTIRFEAGSVNGHTGRNYDIVTGILVYNDATATSQEKPDTWSGNASALSFSELIGSRQISIPWAGAEPPPWFATVSRFVYTGTYKMAPPGVMSSPFPYRVTMDVTGRGRTWFQYRASTAAGGIAGLPPVTNQYDLVSGIAQIGGLWVPPGAGRGLPAGKVLDRNPALGITVTVTRNSGNTLVLTETGPDHTTQWTYDTNTGILQALRQEIRPFGITVDIRNQQVN